MTMITLLAFATHAHTRERPPLSRWRRIPETQKVAEERRLKEEIEPTRIGQLPRARRLQGRVPPPAVVSSMEESTLQHMSFNPITHSVRAATALARFMIGVSWTIAKGLARWVLPWAILLMLIQLYAPPWLAYAARRAALTFVRSAWAWTKWAVIVAIQNIICWVRKKLGMEYVKKHIAKPNEQRSWWSTAASAASAAIGSSIIGDTGSSLEAGRAQQTKPVQQQPSNQYVADQAKSAVATAAQTGAAAATAAIDAASAFSNWAASAVGLGAAAPPPSHSEIGILQRAPQAQQYQQEEAYKGGWR